MGILKDLIDQLEEDCGPVNKPLPFADVRESDPPLPVVVSSEGQVSAVPLDSPHIRVYDGTLRTQRDERTTPQEPDNVRSLSEDQHQDGEASFPAIFRVDQPVQFTHLRELNILEGIICEAKYHGFRIGWWYLVDIGDRRLWIGESHIKEDGQTTSSNGEGSRGLPGRMQKCE